MENIMKNMDYSLTFVEKNIMELKSEEIANFYSVFSVN